MSYPRIYSITPFSSVLQLTNLFYFSTTSFSQLFVLPPTVQHQLAFHFHPPPHPRGEGPQRQPLRSNRSFINMRFCPSFHATLRQSFCRSLLLACLSLTLVENTYADERIGSLPSASLSARNQLHERSLSDLSSVQQSAFVPRSPRLSLIKRGLSLGVDTSGKWSFAF